MAFCQAVERAPRVTTFTYSMIGLRPGTDLLLWRLAGSLDDLEEAAAAALRAGQRSGRDRDRSPQRGRRRPGGPDWTGGGAGPDRGDRGDDRGQESRDQAAVAAGAASGGAGAGAGEEG